ncbi:MAG: uracil-DNA glycosylase [Pseudomonadota bacterium]
MTAVVAEAPINRFEERPPAPAAKESVHPTKDFYDLAPEPAGDPSPPLHGDDDAPEIADARDAARTATTLKALHAALLAFDGCALKTTAKNTCPGEGPGGAPIMFVGEAPGRDEDEAGRPFVGRSGRLLERMLAAIGFSREDVYISNVIPWRPPGNRTPSTMEIATCEVFVRREIDLVAPKILVPLGGPASKTLLATNVGIMRQRGRWTRYPGWGAGTHMCDAIAMYHPAYLLRTPSEKRKTWQDLLALRARLEAEHGVPPAIDAPPASDTGARP